MASSFDHEDFRFLLVASTQLYVSHALILPGCARGLDQEDTPRSPCGVGSCWACSGPAQERLISALQRIRQVCEKLLPCRQSSLYASSSRTDIRVVGC